jgi:hypothetical protein
MTEHTKQTLLDIRKQKAKLVRQLKLLRIETDKLWRNRTTEEFLEVYNGSQLSKSESELIAKIHNLAFKEHLIKQGFEAA